MKNFTLRISTALVLIFILFVVWHFFPLKGVVVLVSLLTAGLIWEYMQLVFYKKPSTGYLIVFSSGYFLLYLSLLLMNFALLEMVIFMVYICFIASFWMLRSRGISSLLHEIGLALIALFYIILPALLILKMFLRWPNGQEALLLFLLIICSGDIFAYLGGSFFKGKKWVPLISPNKTWAGLLCGLFVSGLVATFGSVYLMTNQILVSNFIFGSFSFFIAQTGDLFVSALKRQANVKDTGYLLPGHGGLLDRLDGLLIACPFMYIFALKYGYFI